jgi:hypothetical protein
VQDLWWSGAQENGWGMSVVQRGDTLFAVIFAYNEAGQPVWYVMPGGLWNESRTSYSGPVYTPRGSPFYSYDATHLQVGPPVGSVTLTFANGEQAMLGYMIHGASGTKSMVRQPFGPPSTHSAGARADMWWGGDAESGWGLAVLQQFATLFSVWFTYDASGAATWYVLPGGTWSDANVHEGRIYRTTGSPWAGRAYDASKLRVFDVGSFRMRFHTDGVAATFDYLIQGRTGRLSLTRQPL